MHDVTTEIKSCLAGLGFSEAEVFTLTRIVQLRLEGLEDDPAGCGCGSAAWQRELIRVMADVINGHLEWSAAKPSVKA